MAYGARVFSRVPSANSSATSRLAALFGALPGMRPDSGTLPTPASYSDALANRAHPAAIDNRCKTKHTSVGVVQICVSPDTNTYMYRCMYQYQSKLFDTDIYACTYQAIYIYRGPLRIPHNNPAPPRPPPWQSQLPRCASSRAMRFIPHQSLPCAYSMSVLPPAPVLLGRTFCLCFCRV